MTLEALIAHDREIAEARNRERGIKRLQSRSRRPFLLVIDSHGVGHEIPLEDA